MCPKSGDVLRITRSASVQFRVPFMFRVIRVQDWPCPDGWAWLDGYQLDSAGDAVERRSIFVQLRGLQRAVPAQLPAPAQTGHVAAPAPRSRARRGSPVQVAT